jgi:hypothetical protein
MSTRSKSGNGRGASDGNGNDSDGSSSGGNNNSSNNRSSGGNNNNDAGAPSSSEMNINIDEGNNIQIMQKVLAILAQQSKDNTELQKKQLQFQIDLHVIHGQMI